MRRDQSVVAGGRPSRARRRRATGAIALGLALLAPSTAAATTGGASGAGIEHVVHVSVDGVNSSMLADLMTRDPAGTANWRRLLDEGASTLDARTDPTQTHTLPNHTSMLTARPVAQPTGMPDTTHHGWTANVDPAPGQTLHNAGNPALAYVPGVFDVVHDNGGSTALYASKTKFSLFDVSWDGVNGAPDLVGEDDGTDKIDVALLAGNSATMQAQVLSELPAQDWTYAFVHYTDPDTAGHHDGWGTPHYDDALRTVDGHLGQLLASIEGDPELAGRTAVVLTSDHGGGNPATSHSVRTDPANFTVPVIVWGPGVTAGADLYALNPDRHAPAGINPGHDAPSQPIRNGDTGSLALSLLGLPAIDGALMTAPLDVFGPMPPSPEPTPTPTPTPEPTPSPTPTTATVEVRITSPGDDVEESTGNGRMSTNSSDLELVDDTTYYGHQAVGLRFTGLPVPAGATITAAWVTFTADETDSAPTDLTIRAQATANAPAFTTATADLTSRPMTTATATWAPEPWTVVGATHQTTDLSAVLQEVIDQPGWTNGNAVVLRLDGTGERTAEAREAGANLAPLLHVEYTLDGEPTPTGGGGTSSAALLPLAVGAAAPRTRRRG